MPVYLLTAHAYRSWREDDPRGYIQHGRGLQAPNKRLAAWRDAAAKHPPARFDDAMQSVLAALVPEVNAEEAYRDVVKLHALSTTPTHLHLLMSFRDPACRCVGGRGLAPRGSGSEPEPPGASPWPDPRRRVYCRATCDARHFAARWLARVKTIGGYRLAKHTGESGRQWFSGGWDVTPVRDAGHFGFLCTAYLPKHTREGGHVVIYAKEV